MGAGKTSVGRVLAHRLNWVFEDLDERIERQHGSRIAEIFSHFGEQAFRLAEHAALKEVLAESPQNGGRVVALGGGAFAQAQNAELLRAVGAAVVFLDAPVEQLWERCSKQAFEAGIERPLLRSSLSQFRELYRARQDSYRQATVTVLTQGRAVEEIAAEITDMLGLERFELLTKTGESSEV